MIAGVFEGDSHIPSFAREARLDALAPELEGLDDVEGRHAGLQAGMCRIGAWRIPQ